MLWENCRSGLTSFPSCWKSPATSSATQEKLGGRAAGVSADGTHRRRAAGMQTFAPNRCDPESIPSTMPRTFVSKRLADRKAILFLAGDVRTAPQSCIGSRRPLQYTVWRCPSPRSPAGRTGSSQPCTRSLQRDRALRPALGTRDQGHRRKSVNSIRR